MAISRNKYSPLTCACVYELQIDDSTNPSTKTLYAVHNRCPEHQHITNDTTFTNVVIEENSRYAYAYGLILDNAPNNVFDLDESGSRVFKKGITVSWAFTGETPNRVLTITVTGITLTQNQINSIQTKLNERFGVSNVTIVN